MSDEDQTQVAAWTPLEDGPIRPHYLTFIDRGVEYEVSVAASGTTVYVRPLELDPAPQSVVYMIPRPSILSGILSKLRQVRYRRHGGIPPGYKPLGFVNDEADGR